MNWSISERAEEDIEDIIRFGLENFGVGQARSYAEAMYETFGWIALSPRAGQVRLRLPGRDLLTRVFRSHIIIYSVRDDEHVTIERVQSSRADWTRLLD